MKLFKKTFTLLILAMSLLSFNFASFSQEQVKDQKQKNDGPKLPKGLIWLTNNEDPEYASPDAKKGGTLRIHFPSFPTTLRTYGPDSLDAFATYTRGVEGWYPTHIHPNTSKPIPFLATHWAYGSDHKSIYYRLNKNAKWSDGRPITADDYIFSLEFLLSKFLVDPGVNAITNDYFERIEKYDDYTIGIIGKIKMTNEDMHYQYTLAPKPKHFYKLDKNFIKNYNWAFVPSPGPYVFSKVNKGKYVIMKRVENWWAKDLKYFKNRYNPDQIRISVIRDENIAFEHFKKAELDLYQMDSSPEFWHIHAKGEVFDKGYAGKIQFYTDRVRPSYGLYLNSKRDFLADINIRLGIAHSLNFEKLFAAVMRGDAQRLNTHYVGAGKYTNTKIKAYPYDTNKAISYFNKAGLKERGADGIFIKDGKKLSFEILYGRPFQTEWLVFLKEEAKKAGLELNLKLLDATTFFKVVMEGNHEIAFMGWNTAMPPFYEYGFHSKNAGLNPTNNITYTKIPQLDELIDSFNNEYDQEKKYKLAHDIEQIIHEDSAAIPAHMFPFSRAAYLRWIKYPKTSGTKQTDRIVDIFSTAGVESGALFWIDEEMKKNTLAAMKDDKAFKPVTIIDSTYKVK